MKRPLTYITASMGVDPTENTEIAAKYSRKVFDAGYSPICLILMQVNGSNFKFYQ